MWTWFLNGLQLKNVKYNKLRTSKETKIYYKSNDFIVAYQQIIWRHTIISGLWTQELDTGLWTLDYGRWTLGAGLWKLDSGTWTLDALLWTLDTGNWTLSLTVSEQNQNPVSDSAWLNYWKSFGCEPLRTFHGYACSVEIIGADVAFLRNSLLTLSVSS